MYFFVVVLVSRSLIVSTGSVDVFVLVVLVSPSLIVRTGSVDVFVWVVLVFPSLIVRTGSVDVLFCGRPGLPVPYSSYWVCGCIVLWSSWSPRPL